MRLELVGDAAIAKIAARQHGLVTFRQVLDCGLSQSGIQRRVRAGRLHRIHRGVYAVGHPGLGLPGTWMAAVLAGGAGALLSHRSAAYLWRILKPIPGPAHITVPPTGGRARRKGLVIHRAILLPSQTHAKAGIPVTSPARTLWDLRRIAPPSEYRQALRQADFERLDLGEIPTDGTRSELETLFLKLLKRHRLPAPETNARLGPFLVDCLWRTEHLGVELDGYERHSGRQAFEDDRARDAYLVAHGYRVLRFTWRQVKHEPRLVAGTIRAAIHAHAAQGSGARRRSHGG